MQNFISFFLILSGFFTSVSAQTFSKETILIETAYGNMKIKLYEETPLHKANFLKLVNEHFFDSLLFHRVINNFMIQGGDQLSRHAKPGDSLGHGDIGYTIPAEFNPTIIHKKGRLCAARESDEINPRQESSASQFYIVMGKKRTPEDLKKYEERINKTHYTRCAREFIKSEEGKKLKQEYNRLKAENKTDSAAMVNRKIEEAIQAEHLKTPEYKFNKQQVDVYTTVGGTPHLDGTYTVFGEVVEGLDVIDKIAGVKTDKRDRPLEDIRMRISVIN
jgi:cyclophilin family peptidyl-prolyl cis-trans isomerase